MTEIIRIPNIENYTQEIINRELILTPIKRYITENELSLIQIRNSIIQNCLIKNGENIISTAITYRSMLIDIWKTMPTQRILQNTTFNFKLTNENGENGYRWCHEINMSFRNKNAQGTLKEILKMIRLNNYTIEELSIKLETNNIIYFRTI